ncbi:MAG: hypothetical protein C4576_05080 [Desulfobacteraceae bacterium]|nr:MAG: hypothetical protein C4576_05080 [Desulfobacteraceae bacterium]
MQQKTTREKTIVDFIVAVVENRALGVDFARRLRPRVRAEEIRAYLQGLGYAGTTVEECEQILKIVNKLEAEGRDALH